MRRPGRTAIIAIAAVVVVATVAAGIAIFRSSPKRRPPALDLPGVTLPPPPPAGLRALTVTAFGAVGDGVHDDTAAIQAAINAQQSAVGAKVYLPAGAFLVRGLKDGPTDPPRDSEVALVVEGAGMDKTTIRTSTGALWAPPGPGRSVPQLMVDNLTMDGNYSGVVAHPGSPPGSLEANPVSAMVNLPYPGQSISAPTQSYAGRLHQFRRVRFYRATGFVFQPTKAYITDSVFDSDGQPDLPLTLTNTELSAPLPGGTEISSILLPRLDFRVWPGLRLVINPGPHQQLLTCAAKAPASDGPVSLAVRPGVTATTTYPAGTAVRLARSHADTLGSGGTTSIVIDNQFVDGTGNYADFVGSAVNPARLIFSGNRSLRYRQGGLYGMGWYSVITDNELRNQVSGSGVGYDATSNRSWHGHNLIRGNTFGNLALPRPSDLGTGDEVIGNTLSP